MSVITLKGFPLSAQQVRLYTLQENIQTFRVFCQVRVDGPLSHEVLQEAFASIISRYSILRTRFYCPPGMDVPMQVVSSQAEMLYEELDLSELDAEHQTSRIASLSAELKTRPFDLENGPLVHILLLRTEAHTHQLFFSLPALCADTVTLKLIIAELGRAYEANLRGEVAVEEPVLQYTDVSAWQDELFQEEDAAKFLAYWKQIDLTGLHTQPLPFHAGGPRTSTPVIQPSTPRQFSIQLPEELRLQLQQFARQGAIPLETVLLTIWQIALSRLTDETDLVIGVTFDGRNHEELETTPGFCTRVVPLAAHFNSERTFTQCVESMHALLAQIHEQQTYFSWRTQETQFQFFPLGFEYILWPQDWKSSTISFSCLEEYSYLEPSTLKLRGVQKGDACQLELHYDPAYFTNRRIERLADIVCVLLKNALLRPAESVGRLDLLNEAEQQHLLEQWCGPRSTFVYQPLARLFEKNAALTPSALAVICSEQSLTYEQLNQLANRLAHRLCKLGVGPDVLVGLYVERGIDMLIGLLGILKAGGAYVPLDPALPMARLEQQLTQITLPVVLTQESLLGRLPALSGQILCLDRDAWLLTEEAETNPEIAIEPEHRAYVIVLIEC